MPNERKDFYNQQKRSQSSWHQENQNEKLIVAKEDLDNIKKAIENGLENYNIIKVVEKVASSLAKQKLSTSQVRQFYGEIKRIQMNGLKKELSSLLLLVPKLYYNMKRNENSDGLKGLKELVETMVTAIDNEKDDDRRNEKFKRMTQVAEAFVAFHKVYEGQETKSKKDTQQSS